MATLNTADQLRLFIGDRPRFAQETYFGDGTASSFQISGFPLVSGCTALGGFQPTAFVTGNNPSAWSATGATFDYNFGRVTFSAVPSADSAFQVIYSYANFSDQEIDFLTANYPNTKAMRMAMIDTLMADAYKRTRWSDFRGGQFDDSQTMSNLMKMRDAVWKELTVEQGPIGALISWGQSQENDGS